MESDVLYCIECGSPNEIGAKFCFKCGKPIKAPQSRSNSQPASDFITLACPKCGGSLEITPDMDRFACKFCGSEHLVRRSGGMVSLAPVVEGMKRVEEKFDRALIGADRMAAEQTIQRLKNELVGLERQAALDQAEVNFIQSQVINEPGKKLFHFGLWAIFLSFGIPIFAGILTTTAGLTDGQYSLIALLLLPIGIGCVIAGLSGKNKTAGEILLAEHKAKLEKAKAAMQRSQELVEDHKKRLEDLHRYTTER